MRIAIHEELNMTTYDDISEVFEEFTVWHDNPAELFWYRWAWDKIAPSCDMEDLGRARVVAATLVYVYAELCYYVCDENFYEDAWDLIDEPTRELVQNDHDQVVEALKSAGAMPLLIAFHASWAKPQRIATDEDGDECEEGLIADYESFCRYIDDDAFRDEDVAGMSVSAYEDAYGWLCCGAEMLEARTDGD